MYQMKSIYELAKTFSPLYKLFQKNGTIPNIKFIPYKIHDTVEELSKYQNEEIFELLQSNKLYLNQTNKLKKIISKDLEFQKKINIDKVLFGTIDIISPFCNIMIKTGIDNPVQNITNVFELLLCNMFNDYWNNYSCIYNIVHGILYVLHLNIEDLNKFREFVQGYLKFEYKFSEIVVNREPHLPQIIAIIEMDIGAENEEIMYYIENFSSYSRYYNCAFENNKIIVSKIWDNLSDCFGHYQIKEIEAKMVLMYIKFTKFGLFEDLYNETIKTIELSNFSDIVLFFKNNIKIIKKHIDLPNKTKNMIEDTINYLINPLYEQTIKKNEITDRMKSIIDVYIKNSDISETIKIVDFNNSMELREYVITGFNAHDQNKMSHIYELNDIKGKFLIDRSIIKEINQFNSDELYMILCHF